MWALPAFFMTADTSAKSRLMKPVFLMRSEMDWTAWLKHVVGDLKGVGEGDLLVGGKLQPLVGDDDQAVHLVAQLLDALLGLLHAAAALKAEGLGDHAHGEDAHAPWRCRPRWGPRRCRCRRPCRR